MAVIKGNILWFVAGFVVSMFVFGGIFLPLFGGYTLALVGYRRKLKQEVLFSAQSAIIGIVLFAGITYVFTRDMTYSLMVGVGWGIISGFLAGNGIRTRGL